MDSVDHVLRSQVDTVAWRWLRPHAERGVLILVDRMLDLAEVGERLAADDRSRVEAWLASRLLIKPTAEQADSWDRRNDKLFRMLIISPFVLVQEQSE